MDTAIKILAVGAGGALGSIARYLINISPAKDVFERLPFPTLIINISGSFLIGLMVTLFTGKYDASENVRLAFLVGFLGAYTTFSAFELETWTLIREGNYLTGLGYVLLSVVLGLVAVIGGIELARRLG